MKDIEEIKEIKQRDYLAEGLWTAFLGFILIILLAIPTFIYP